ncbi:Transcription elongation factor SPT6, partial [Fragariocoptes setiger]
MADFVDSEAHESEGSEDDEVREELLRSKAKRKGHAEIDDSSEEEEDDEEQMAEEMKDLINDEEEEDEDDDGDSDDDGSDRKRSHDESSLDSADLDLIEENAGVRVRKKKKFKRIRRIRDEDADEDADDDRQAIASELFGDADGQDADDGEEAAHRSSRVDDEIEINSDEDESESDEDDFIVDDNDQPISKPRKKKSGSKHTDAAMQQAQEIFGVDFDFNDLDADDEGDAYDEEDEGEYEDEEEGELDENGEVIKRAKLKKKKTRKSIFDFYEPAELEQEHLSAVDTAIRLKDEPERFVTRPMTDADEAEIDLEAEWLNDYAFTKRTISVQEPNHEPIAGGKSGMVSQIKEALKFMRNSKLEVPFIYFYRREYIMPLSMSDLWTIFKADEKWCRLKSSKDHLLKLYTDMADYAKYKFETEGHEDPKLRKVTEKDIERVTSATCTSEVEDCRAHWTLHYSTYLREMQEFRLKKVRERRISSPNANHKEDEEKNPDDELNDKDNEGEDKKDSEKEKEIEEEKLYERLAKFKISKRKDLYQQCREDNLSSLVAKFGLKPDDFGENLRDDYQRHNVKQHPAKPQEAAEAHLLGGSKFRTKEEILRAARYMYAKEIAFDPLVRQTVRKYYFDNAVINVRPTKVGMKELDENHPIYTYKYLKNFSVSKLTRDQFVQLTAAEKADLITMSMTIEPIESVAHGKAVSPYYESLKQLYFSDFSSLVTREWNEQREQAVEMAMKKFIIPSMERELREKLTQEAHDKIIKSCCHRLFDHLKKSPYSADPTFREYKQFDLQNGLKVMGITSSSEPGVPSFAVIINGDGEVIEHIRLAHLFSRNRRNMTLLERQAKEKDRESLKDLVKTRRPHVIALGDGPGVETYYHARYLQEIMEQVSSESKKEVFPVIPVEIVDSELSHVLMSSKKMQQEFPEFPPSLRQAVSLARRLADPLLEFAQLCSPDEEIICLKYHPLQDVVAKNDLLEALQSEFIFRVNEVGVDINRAINHPHTASVVQFVCGLGPRKGTHLLRTIRKLPTPLLQNRGQLVTDCSIGATVFLNCAGFIKIDAAGFQHDYQTDQYINLLDSTRIHPEAYDWAKKIATDALEGDETDDRHRSVDYEEDPDAAVERIFQNPEFLRDLDLDAFAMELERQGFGSKRDTLHNVREEFTNPYKDRREEYKSPHPEELFTMLTKETPSSFYVGKLVTCQVTGIQRRKPTPQQFDSANPNRDDETGMWKCPFCMRADFQDLTEVWHHFDNSACPGPAMGLRCSLDNGITGFVPTRFISDSEVHDPSQRVQVGMTIHARVVKINIERFGCDLTCRSSDLNDRENKWKPAKCEDYDHEAEEADRKLSEAQSKKAQRRPYHKRVIVHPSFHNINFATAEKRLADMEQGSAIIRPSSQGPEYLTLSWKVADGINQHVSIREEGKENAFSLGHQLFIDGEPYEDLDEIIARYVQPMASFARDLLAYKYCRPPCDQERHTLSNMLFDEQSKLPNKIHYLLCPSKEFPGKFLLSYLPRKKVRHEYISITPQGYRYRKNYFNSVAGLVKWYKEHFQDPIFSGTPLNPNMPRNN